MPIQSTQQCITATCSVATSLFFALTAQAAVTSQPVGSAQTGAGPAVAVLPSSHHAIPDFDAADRDAHVRQFELRALEDAGAPAWEIAFARSTWEAAEADADTARAAAWSSFSSGQTLASIVSAPLELAMLDLHLELRRGLGPVFHSEVPGLDREPGCAGDLIVERVVAAYGAEVVNPLGSDSEETLAELERFAVQIACLGSAQLARLDRALTKGFRSVEERMADHGQSALDGAFARIVAPLELLVLDARKHRGTQASAWRWFRVYGRRLDEATQNAGWATGELLVWDRRHGMLLGLPECNGALAPDCVDLGILLASVEDPRALGLGGCGLVAMISRGAESIDGDPRYACPVQDCSAPSAAPGLSAGPGTPSVTGVPATLASAGALGLSGGAHTLGGTSPLAAELTSLWGGAIAPGDVSAMLGFCQGPGDRFGPTFDVESCFDSLPSPDAQNPFAAHIACMEDALDSTAPAPGVELRGVPNGPECGLVGEGESPPPKEPVKEEEKKPAEEPEKEEPKVAEPIDGATPKVTARPLKYGNEYSYGVGAGMIAWVEVLDAQTDEFIRFQVTVTGMSVKEASDALSREIYREDSTFKEYQYTFRGEVLEIALADALDNTPPSDPNCSRGCEGRSPSLPPGFRPQGCLDPVSCGGNECSGLGEQVREATACNEALIDDLAEAAGRPSVDPTNPPDIVSNWGPDSDHGVEDSVGICLSEGHHPRPPAHCGLIMCANGAMAVPIGDECGCASTPPIAVEQVCIEAICADGSIPGPDCRCGGSDVPGSGPIPPDVTRTGGEGWLP